MAASKADAADEPSNEHATFQYIDWQNKYEYEKPYQVFSAVSIEQLDGAESTNLVFKDGPIETIYDARPALADFQLDVNGFAFCQHHLTYRFPMLVCCTLASVLGVEMVFLYRED